MPFQIIRNQKKEKGEKHEHAHWVVIRTTGRCGEHSQHPPVRRIHPLHQDAELSLECDRATIQRAAQVLRGAIRGIEHLRGRRGRACPCAGGGKHWERWRSSPIPRDSKSPRDDIRVLGRWWPICSTTMKR